jgi:uncharacterized repeat protein (TIGR01451 family)
MVAIAEISNQKGEGNNEDNSATATTKVPAMDLWIGIEGDPEGLTPGLLPNMPISYRIEFGNQGVEPSCANKVSFSVDEHVTVDAFDFSRLSLSTSEGRNVHFQNPAGQDIGSSVAVSHTVTERTYTFDLGEHTCLPGGTQGSFEMFVRTKNNLPDSTPIAATVKIWEESAAKEDTMLNNEAVNSTMVYLADMMISKSAIVDSNGDEIFDTTTDSTLAAIPRRKVQYTLEYDNIGNYSAKNVVIRDSLPAEVCFEIGSIALSEGYSIEYSNDKGMTRNYVSNKNDGEEDCAITDFRVVLEDELMAPGHKIEGGFQAVIQEFTGNTTWTVPSGIREVEVFVVGGGGAGAGSKGANYAGNGGNGGVVKTGTLTVTP